jgi:hypothetical protein
MIRVVKLGGSLLNLPQLPDRLRHWLAVQPEAHHVLVAGGGPLVDQIRTWHAEEPINDVAAHWMCVDLLTVTAHLLHAWLPELPLIEDDRLLCQRVGEPGGTIFGPARWMRHAEPALPGAWLPSSWDTTTVIAGDGEEHAALLRLIDALNLQDRVVLTGSLTDAQLVDHLASCRAVCFAPLQEDYGFVTAEAFASAKAVVTCHDSGGPAELVQDGVQGLITDPTPHALAAALRRVMKDQLLAETLGAEARKAVARLNWADTVRQLTAL